MKEIIQISISGEATRKFNSLKEASEELNVTIGAISNCLNKRTKTCCDSYWMYAKDVKEFEDEFDFEKDLNEFEDSESWLNYIRIKSDKMSKMKKLFE